jgi:hypothetical protein
MQFHPSCLVDQTLLEDGPGGRGTAGARLNSGAEWAERVGCRAKPEQNRGSYQQTSDHRFYPLMHGEPLEFGSIFLYHL